MSKVLSKRLDDLIRSAVTALDFELWGCEFLSRGRRPLLRIYIEREKGITIDDCECVSRQVSALLDVEELIRGGYDLEVSSPGLDRPLYTKAHFQRYVGNQVRVRMKRSISGRRQFSGLLQRVSDDTICIEEAGEAFELPLAEIEKANLRSMI